MPKNRGRQIEDAVIKFIGARKHLNSGAMAEKWDADTHDLLIEIKSTAAKSYSHKRDYFDHLSRDANRRDKLPVIILAWDDGQKSIDMDDMNIICNLSDFLVLLNCDTHIHYPEYGEVII